MKPSTRSFIRESRRTPGYSFLDWLHGYVYGRWTYFTIGIGKGSHPMNRIFGPPLRWLACLLLPGLSNKNALAEGYHGKVIPLEALSLMRDPSKGKPLAIHRLISGVNNTTYSK